MSEQDCDSCSVHSDPYFEQPPQQFADSDSSERVIVTVTTTALPNVALYCSHSKEPLQCYC